MICWWCHWGWPKPIADIFDDCVKRLGDDEGPLISGPAHVVWGDENWDLAESCLEDLECHEVVDMPLAGEYVESQLSVVRESLERLATLPDEWKHAPAGYGEKSDPVDFPPPSNWKMVRR